MKWLRRVLLALLFSLLVGLAIGTWLRLRLEHPVYYIGAAERSGLLCSPLFFGETGAAVLDAGHHEEQVG